MAKEIEDEKKAELKRQTEKYHVEQKRIEDEAKEKKRLSELEKKRLLKNNMKNNMQNRLSMLNDSDVRKNLMAYSYYTC
jgi:hypothetical protein